MRTITYIGPSAAVDIADTGLTAEQGVPIELDDELAKCLLEQESNWQANETSTQRKAREHAEKDAAEIERAAAKAAADATKAVQKKQADRDRSGN